MIVSLRPIARESDLVFTLAAGSADDFKVVALRGVEGISRMSEFRVELVSDDADVDLDAALGETCLVTVFGQDGVRYVSGIVRRFERLGRGVNRTHYAADVVPAHWRLSERRKSRVFQPQSCADMTAPGIIRKVLEDAGLADDSFRFALEQEYAEREFVSQYRESDLDFISRLMEDAGLFYYFEHSAAGHVLVIGDGPSAMPESPTAAEVRYRDANGLVAEGEHVFALRESRQIRPGTATLDDFNFKQPATQLRATHSADAETALEHLDYPGEFADRGEGERLAQLRLEAAQCSRRTVEMSTTLRTLAPGQRFALSDHPSTAANREYLATSVEHAARQPQGAEEEAGRFERGLTYETVVRAIPADTPFRAPRVTPRPTVPGSQTALVVGPAGEEIYTDEYGRVKVQFHWDQEGVYDEHSSCWIRVSQGWAGGSYGMFFLPRVGQEVVVDFLEGNPDRPIITGSVHNNDNMPPFRLPDEKTRSVIRTRSTTGGGGANEIRFDDAKDAEQLFLQAQKDMHLRTKNDRVENVGRDHHLTVDQHKYELVKQNQHAETRLDLLEKVGGGKHLEVAGAVSETFGGNHHEQVGARYYLDAAGDLVLESAQAITLKVGGNFIKIDATGVYIMGTVTHINSEGAAGNGTTVALKSPAAPLEADTTEPGTDVAYAADPHAYTALEGQTDGASSDEGEEEAPTSWIEIELVDEAGQPWPNEPYEVSEPDGTVKRGSLDANGQAHVAVSAPGECQISFPKLDRRAWERA